MKWRGKGKEKSRTGLLFSPIKTYEGGVWDAAFKQARERGLSYEEAKRHADDALRYAKEAAKRGEYPKYPNPETGISESNGGDR